MLLVLAPVQTLAAELHFDGRFKELLLKCCCFSNGMEIVLKNSVYNIQGSQNPNY